jgi:multicomponent K+:H+ antiporter subunit E
MNFINRMFPMPFQSILIVVVWLMLNNTLSPGHIILAVILGIFIPYLCAPLRIPQPRMAKPLKLIPYILMVFKDVVVANVEVAMLVVGPTKRIQPGFIAIPLDIKDDLPITMLASTVSMTPGTVSAEISEDKQFLYVHVLNMPADIDALIGGIKVRYEAKLMEIFGC